MSSDSDIKTKRDDEVDLTDLFAKLGSQIIKWMRSAGRVFLASLFFLMRKWLWLIISLVISTGISYLVKLSSEKIYFSDMTLKSNTVSNVEMIAYINKLHAFCRGKNLSELASALNVDGHIVKDVKDIKAHWVIDMGPDGIPDYVDYKDNYRLKDTLTLRMQDRLVIRVKTSVPKEISSIRDGIIAFIENNDFFQDQNRLRLRQAEDMLARIEFEVEQLDSLQKVKYFEESRRLMPKEGGQMIFLQEFKTQLLHEDIYTMIQRKQEIETLKTIYGGIVTIINDFTPPSKPENGTMYYGKIIIPLMLALTIIALLITDNRKRLREIYSKYNNKKGSY